jgi:hypothetical protein
MSDELVREDTTKGAAGNGNVAENGDVSLWIGLFLPPIAWALQMQLNYWLVRGACARDSRLALFAVTLISLLLVTAAGFSSFLGWRRIGVKWPSGFGDRVSRSRFMAVLGLLMAALFFMVIVAQGMGVIVFHPCQL